MTTLSLFINFQGNCREAVEFYSKIFNTKPEKTMTYGEFPPEPGMKLSEEDKNLIGYTALSIHDHPIMFSDSPPETKFTAGNNVSISLTYKDEKEMREVFGKLSEGGKILMDLQKTFWSELFGYFQDKYGVYWMLMLYK